MRRFKEIKVTSSRSFVLGFQCSRIKFWETTVRESILWRVAIGSLIVYLSALCRRCRGLWDATNVKIIHYAFQFNGSICDPLDTGVFDESIQFKDDLVYVCISVAANKSLECLSQQSRQKYPTDALFLWQHVDSQPHCDWNICIETVAEARNPVSVPCDCNAYGNNIFIAVTRIQLVREMALITTSDENKRCLSSVASVTRDHCNCLLLLCRAMPAIRITWCSNQAIRSPLCFCAILMCFFCQASMNSFVNFFE